MRVALLALALAALLTWGWREYAAHRATLVLRICCERTYPEVDGEAVMVG